jgi:hypothetical protein
MQARTEALVGGGALIALVALAAALGARGNRLDQEDRRSSTFLSGPHGARGLAESLERLGTDVRRERRGLRRLQPDSAVDGRTALVLLDPREPIHGVEVELVRAWADATPQGDLILAGRGAAQVMRCFGYALDWRFFDSVEVTPRSFEAEFGEWPKAAGVLASSRDTIVADSTRLEDTGVTACIVPPIASVDTLITSVTGRVVALRLEREDTGGEVVLLADAGFFRNRALRETPAGPFTLGLFAGRYRRVIFEEAHHGFEEGGSLAGATLAWSLRSPWGWAMWQMGIVGLLALLGAAFRFGPARPIIQRRRRSPLEHVRALATALAAARGHDVAIGRIVEGLRRRLIPSPQRPAMAWRDWLESLGENLQSERARNAVRTLQTLSRPGQTPEGVLQAANAVEDVWEELRP